MRVEHRFRVMGSDAHLVVDAESIDLAERLVADAEQHVRDLEARWSRFVDTSELSVVNRSLGRPVMLSPDTFEIVQIALDASRITGGLFDPTILGALHAAGYRRSFVDGVFEPGGPTDVAGPGAIELDVDLRAVVVHVPIDLGGIGKGRAADLVAEDLIASGAVRAVVNLGGDVRVAGAGEPVTVGIEHPAQPTSGVLVDTVTLAEGAVATSSVLRRQWAGGHHLIDPRTGRPSTSDLVAVTVLAGTCAWAEVFAKAAVIAGSDEALELLAEHALTARLVFADGRVERIGDPAFVAGRE
jgi:FAD:protein FMN transferase